MRLSSVCISRSSRFVLFHKSLHERSFATTPQHLSDLSNFAATTRKVCCIGRNYVDHIKELGNKAGKEPFFFLKPPTSILAPGQGSMLIPKGIEAHYEIELGIVIGQTIKDLKKTDKNKAMDSIGGYFLGIDMTARNMQEEMKKKGLPWTTAKGFDTWLPVSRFIPKARIPDPSDVVLKLTVNDVEKQNDSTKLMIYDVAVCTLSGSIKGPPCANIQLISVGHSCTHIVDNDTAAR